MKIQNIKNFFMETETITLYRVAWKDLNTGRTGHGEWLTREWLVDGYVIDFAKENTDKKYWKETKLYNNGH